MRIPKMFSALLAIGLVTGLPTAAYCLAPAHETARQAAPGSKLGGFNSTAVGTGAQVEVLLPGIAPLGDATKGNFIQASMPYATSSSATGPTTSGTAAPVWPGEVVANAGNDLQTFSPSIPPALVKLLNYPAVANSVYPAQVNVGRSGGYQPPGGAQANAGTATTRSGEASTRASATLNDTTPLGSLPKSSPLVKALSQLNLGPASSLLGRRNLVGAVGSAPLVRIASSKTVTTAAVNAGSVVTTATTDVNDIVVAGLIHIDGVTSTAVVTSQARHGSQRSRLKVGKVTVAGQAASIGPKGIHLLGKASAGPNPVATVNQLLAKLKKSGLTIKTVAPIGKVHGARATATSGAVRITFEDQNVPNLEKILPQAPVPFPNSVGLQVNLGLSQVGADSTRSLGFPAGRTGPSPVSSTPSTGSAHLGSTKGGSSGGLGLVASGGSPSGDSPSVAGTPVDAQPASDEVFGLPVRVVWVVVALLLAVLAAGPLLAYANWQLLRGRAS